MRGAVRRRIVLEETGLSSINDKLARDVYIAAYPKSGSTWMQNLVAAVAYGIDPATTPDSVIQELVPDEHYKRYYRRVSSPMVFKSHALPRAEMRRVINVVRDGRDVGVSYFHYLRSNFSDIDTIRQVLVEGRRAYPCLWHEHVLAWHENPYDAEILSVRYEDLLADGLEQLSRIARFLDVPMSRDKLQDVLEKASFQQLRAKEKRLGMSQPEHANTEFFRTGRAGAHRQEIPEQLLVDFERMAEDALRTFGYS